MRFRFFIRSLIAVLSCFHARASVSKLSCTAVFELPRGIEINLDKYASQLGIEVAEVGFKIKSPKYTYPKSTLDEIEQRGVSWSLKHPGVLEIPGIRRVYLSDIENRKVHFNTEAYASFQMAISHEAFRETYPEFDNNVKGIKERTLSTGFEWGFFTAKLIVGGQEKHVFSDPYTSSSKNSLYPDDTNLAYNKLFQRIIAAAEGQAISILDISFFHTHPGQRMVPLSSSDVSTLFNIRDQSSLKKTTFRIYAVGMNKGDLIYRRSLFGEPTGTIAR